MECWSITNKSGRGYFLVEAGQVGRCFSVAHFSGMCKNHSAVEGYVRSKCFGFVNLEDAYDFVKATNGLEW